MKEKIKQRITVGQRTRVQSELRLCHTSQGAALLVATQCAGRDSSLDRTMSDQQDTQHTYKRNKR